VIIFIYNLFLCIGLSFNSPYSMLVSAFLQLKFSFVAILLYSLVYNSTTVRALRPSVPAWPPGYIPDTRPPTGLERNTELVYSLGSKRER